MTVLEEMHSDEAIYKRLKAGEPKLIEVSTFLGFLMGEFIGMLTYDLIEPPESKVDVTKQLAAYNVHDLYIRLKTEFLKLPHWQRVVDVYELDVDFTKWLYDLLEEEHKLIDVTVVIRNTYRKVKESNKD